MRAIKFRGANREEGWVYGNLILGRKEYRGENLDKPVYAYIARFKDNGEVFPIEPVRVAPSTVGQFTGLCDKNGTEIYEGDIVSHPYIDPIFRAIVDESSVKSKVAFHDGAFVINYDVDDFIFLDAFIREGHVEVVGNIHDNPELLTTSKYLTDF